MFWLGGNPDKIFCIFSGTRQTGPELFYFVVHASQLHLLIPEGWVNFTRSSGGRSSYPILTYFGEDRFYTVMRTDHYQT